MNSIVSTAMPLEVKKSALRWWNLIEVLITFAIIEIVVWIPKEERETYLTIGVAWVALGTIAYFLTSGRKLYVTAFRLQHFYQPLWLPLVAAGLAIALWAVGCVFATTHYPTPWQIFAWRFGRYVIWVAVQQFLAQLYFFARLENVSGSGKTAALLTGLVFGIAHLPNPILTIATLSGGMILGLVFARYRSIYLLVATHAVIGFAITFSLPMGLHHGMRVGLTFLTYK